MGKAKGDKLEEMARWEPVKTAFVEGRHDPRTGIHGWPTYDDLSDIFHLHPSAIRTRARAEGWPAEREEYRERLDTERRDAKVSMLSEAAAEFDNQTFNLARMGIEVIGRQVRQVADVTMTVENYLSGAGFEGMMNGSAENRQIAELLKDAVLAYASSERARGDRALEMKRLAEAAACYHALGHVAIGDLPTQRLGNEAPEHIRGMIDRVKSDPKQLMALNQLPLPTGAMPPRVNLPGFDLD